MLSFKNIVFFCAATAISLSAFGEKLKYTENEEVFSNPGQGWAHYGYKLPDAPAVNFGAGYLRLEWAALEPEEGKYNWKLIDDAISYYSSIGLPFYFRIMCTNFHSGSRFSTPKWVFEKGAKFHEFEGVEYNDASGAGEKSKIHASPYFNDEIFLKSHRKFIRALARRYDKNPAIGGIDLGSFGNWGEWHCHGIGLKDPKMYPFEIRKQYADMYLENFKTANLFFMTDDAEVLDYCLSKEKKPTVGLRRDGVGSPWHFKRWIGTHPYSSIEKMADVWKYKPIFFEFFDSQKSLEERGWDTLYSIDWILENHVSLVNDIPFHPKNISRQKPEYKALKKIDLFAGARLVATESETTYEGGILKIRITGENKGVSKIYLPYRMKYILEDEYGNVVWEKDSACDPRKILPGPFEISDNFEVQISVGKKYKLYMRTYHTKRIFKDFKFAVKELDSSGALLLDANFQTRSQK